MSVLENHHCSVAFSIVTKEECAILRNLTKEEFKASWRRRADQWTPSPTDTVSPKACQSKIV